MRPPSLFTAVAILQVLLASSLGAVVIDSGNGSGNTSAPLDDPGWSHLGIRSGLSVIYLG